MTKFYQGPTEYYFDEDPEYTEWLLPGVDEEIDILGITDRLDIRIYMELVRMRQLLEKLVEGGEDGQES